MICNLRGPPYVLSKDEQSNRASFDDYRTDCGSIGNVGVSHTLWASTLIEAPGRAGEKKANKRLVELEP